VRLPGTVMWRGCRAAQRYGRADSGRRKQPDRCDLHSLGRQPGRVLRLEPGTRSARPCHCRHRAHRAHV